MHDQALAWLTAQAATLDPGLVLDLGSRDVNGTCRPLFPRADYVGVDLRPGPGVDIVADAAEWMPDRGFDVVVCTEVLEHAERWTRIMCTAITALRPGGTLLVTAACEPRAPHSAVDGGRPQPGEWYANIDPALLRKLAEACDLEVETVEVHDWPGHGGDVYLRARSIDDGVEG